MAEKMTGKQKRRTMAQRKVEAESLVARLEVLRTQAQMADLDIDITKYQVEIYPRRRKVKIALCVLLVGLIMLVDATSALKRYEEIPPVLSMVMAIAILMTIVGVSFSVVGLFTALMRWLCSEDRAVEIGCSEAEIRRLSDEVADYEERLEKFKKKREEMKPLMRELERLEPIIVKELGGEFALRRELDDYFVKATIDGEFRSRMVTLATYGELVKWIIETRATRKLVAEFEAELEGKSEM